MKGKLYDSISLVNSFRLILNEYFQTDYLLLEDISYPAYKLKQLGEVEIIENTCSSSTE